MISIYQIKPLFQNTLRPLVRALARIGVTANFVTVLAALISLGCGLSIYFFRSTTKVLFLVPPVLFLRMALNAIDGMLAREHGMKTPLGAFLNELGDILSDTFIYLPFAFISNIHPYLIVLVVLLALISEFTGVTALLIGAGRRYDGPMGKSDRAFVFGLIALLLAFQIKPAIWLDIFLITVALLLLITIVNRVYQGLKEIK